VFEASMKRARPRQLPLAEVFRKHTRDVIAGILVCMATFVLFYLMTVFALSWGTTALHYPRAEFLVMQLVAVVFFGAMIPLSAWLAERGRRPVMFGVSLLIAVFGLFMARMFAAGPNGALWMMIVGLALMGVTYGPLGTVVSELFPTPVRYTGSSLAFSMAGILGASLAPYIATWLAEQYGLAYVGYYLTASAVSSMIGLMMIRETSCDDLSVSSD
jgi:MFS family permease